MSSTHRTLAERDASALRGINAKVVQSGTIRVGDIARRR
jgi:hypothetical protein